MKNEVLNALRESESYISGEEISRRIGKSRTAVWQWIEELRRDGYDIEAATRRGYRLVSVPDRLFPGEIERHLETKTLGRRIKYFSSVGSTNDEAKALAKAGAAEGTVVVAEEQTAGRGRRGRAWSSPFGQGIWSSTILRPPLAPYDAPKMALVAALATVEAIGDVTGLDAGIKWPNDVLVAGRKVCGILVEMDAELDLVRYLIVGIGINANMERSAIPEEARPHATTLAVELGRKVPRAELLGRLLTRLERRYEQWKEGGFESLLGPLRERTDTLGAWVRVLEASGEWQGRALDIASDGSLVVVDSTGVERRVYAAEVSIRPEGRPEEPRGT